MDPGLREFGADYSDHGDPKPRKQQILGIEPGLRQLAKKETPTEYGADYNIADDDGSKTKIDKENKNGNKTEKTGNKTETTVKGGDDNGYYYTYYYNYYEPEHGNETNNGTADNGPEEFGIDYGVGHENSTDNNATWYYYYYPDGEGDGKNGSDNGVKEYGGDYGVGHENNTVPGNETEWYWEYYYTDGEGDGKNGSNNGVKEYGGDYGVGHENNTDSGGDVWYWYTYPEGGKNKTEDGEDYGVGHENEESDTYYYTYDYVDSAESTSTKKPKNNEKGHSGSDYMDFGNSKPRKQKHSQKNKTTTKARTTPIKNDTSPIDPFNKDFNIFTDIAG